MNKGYAIDVPLSVMKRCFAHPFYQKRTRMDNPLSFLFNFREVHSKRVGIGRSVSIERIVSELAGKIIVAIAHA